MAGKPDARSEATGARRRNGARWLPPRLIGIVLTLAVAVVASRILRVASSYPMHPSRPADQDLRERHENADDDQRMRDLWPSLKATWQGE